MIVTPFCVYMTTGGNPSPGAAVPRQYCLAAQDLHKSKDVLTTTNCKPDSQRLSNTTMSRSSCTLYNGSLQGHWATSAAVCNIIATANFEQLHEIPQTHVASNDCTATIRILKAGFRQ